MKKLLLSLLSVAAISFASVAETVTYDFANETYGLTRQSDANSDYIANGTEVDNAPAKIVLNNLNTSGTTNWRLWKDGLRATKAVKGEMTISVEGATITELVFSIANNGTNISVNGAAAEAVAKGKTMTWTGNSDEVTAVFTQSSTMAVASIVITYEAAQAGDKQPAGLSYSASSVEVNVNALDKFEAPVLANPNNLAVTYTSSDENVAEVNAEGVVTLSGDEGVAVIKAEFAGDDKFNAGSASYTITVKNAPVNESSEANPYSVAQALAIAKSLDASTNVADVYAKGYVIAIAELSTSFGNATYTIADAADATEGLSVYRGYYLNGDKFTAEDQLQVGAEVVVCGTLVNYKGNTPQFTTGSKIVSYKFEGGETPEPELPALKNLNEAFALNAGDKAIVDFPLTVGFVNGNNILVCDEAGDFIQIYAKNTYKVGDVLAAGWEATYTVRFDVPQFAPAAELPAATEGTFAPKVVAAADVTPAIVNHVIVIENVVLAEATPGKDVTDNQAKNFKGKVGDITLNFRNNYKLESVEAGTYNITLWVNLYNGELSLYVINFEKKDTSAIDEIAVDQEADAVYYNLQGVRVDNPANGVYVRVAGSKVSKVYVR